MSGPTTAIFTADPAAVILAAAAIRAAEAFQAGQEAADALRQQHADAQGQNRQRQAAANLLGQQKVQIALANSEQRYAQLRQLAAPYPALLAPTASQPQRPATEDPSQLAAYLEQLGESNRQLENALRDLIPEPGEALPSGLELTATPLPERSANAQPTSPTASTLFARLANLGPLPANIEALQQEIAACPDNERQALLEIELRQAIQRFEEKTTQEASAIVLEQTLKDLGYQVESVSHTLFVEGGVVHFRRPGWDNYLVHLRLNPTASSVNFNVIRAIEAGNNERSVLDHLAEDRWCSEFPALLQALAAHGLNLNVTRRLAAGELPVQLVDRDKLPQFTEEEGCAPQRAPLHKEIQ